jgi:hypothetical protein
LTGSTAGVTPVVKARVEWGKKWREKTSAKNTEWEMVVGLVELRMANNRRDKVEANVAISDQLVSNPLVKDHDAALGVRSFQIPLRISEVLISAMWHPGVLADPSHRWLRRAVITVCSALIRIDERRKSASQEVGNEKTLFSSGEPRAVKGRVQKGERLLPRSRRAKAGEEAG